MKPNTLLQEATQAFRAAVGKVIAECRRMGEPVAVWRDGFAQWVHPVARMSKVLNHRTREWFIGTSCFWHNNMGRNPREARDHFFALRAIGKDRRGFLLLDGDNRVLPDHELRADGLVIERWKRYEIENYLLHPVALKRFMGRRAVSVFVEKGMEYLQDQLPKSVLRDPLANADYMERMR